MTSSYKSIQPDRKAVLKENRNSHVNVTSAYDHPKATYKHIPQTFTTNIDHERALPTQRPTMGGKTISAIRRPTDIPLSNKDLLLLSRRIDPQEPLSSPHASPSKPPLPKKRQRSGSCAVLLPAKKIKEDDVVQFVCEPCNKKYKTRNGYTYHVERCKARLNSKKVVIHCICQEEDMGTMIECIQCNTWLHIKCVGKIVDEASYQCPRCIKDCISSCQDVLVDGNEDWSSNTQWEDEFTKHTGWPANTTSDPPSLMFSDNLLDDFSSELVLSPTLAQSDWLHFANFELDF